MPDRDALSPPRIGRARRFICVAALALAGSWLVDSCGASARAGDFSFFSGSFRGPGYVLANGARKSLTCRATGETAGDGRVLSQNIACESNFYKFDLRAQYVADGPRARGAWREATRDASGAVSGQFAGQRFTGASEAKGFAGRFKYHLGPRKLIFTFWPDGGDPTRVHVSLARQAPEGGKTAATKTPVAPAEPRHRRRRGANNGLEMLN
jgi:hypothetical protein